MPIIEPTKDIADIINELNDSGFPEYVSILNDIIDYFKNKILNDCDELKISKIICNLPDHGKCMINVLIDDNCEMAKKHHGDEFGFIRLFSLVLNYHKQNININNISLNAKLAVENFDLAGPNIKYENKIIDYDNDPIENDMECSICMISRGPIIETPCNHKFHLQCLKCSPNFVCPLCRTDLKDFLYRYVQSDEIEIRLQIQNNEKEFENLCNDLNFIRLCMETLKLNNGNVIAYNDIIFDMNSNASQLFAQISHKLSLKEKGVFMYLYDSPIEFILQMRDPYSESNVEWVPMSYFEDTPLHNIIQDRVNRIQNIEEDYVVVVMIENVINAHIINRNAYSSEFAIRRHQRDILNSIIKCIRCKCSPKLFAGKNLGSGTNLSSPNREYTWAKSSLAELMKKTEKNRKNRNRRKKF